MAFRAAVIGIVLAIATTSAASAQSALFLYGGAGHRVLLGCINCDRFESASLCNSYGDYGSKYAENSIWNPYGTYGSKYSNESPWNKYTTSAPIIVDVQGGSYGYLSANRYHPGRTQIRGLIQLTDMVGDGASVESAREALCAR